MKNKFSRWKKFVPQVARSPSDRLFQWFCAFLVQDRKGMIIFMKPSENKTIEPETLAWDDLALILSEDINDIKDNSSQEGLQIQIEN